MAPRKRRVNGGDTVASAAEAAPGASKRVTRSSTRRADPWEQRPAKVRATMDRKKRKAEEKVKLAAPEESVEEEEFAKEEASVEEGKASKEEEGPADEKEKEKASGEKDEATAAASSKTVVIEHCKQCNSFKTRALKVKDGLESGVAGITVLVNPEKPRRGCFEIREDGGETFISLLDMKRPFNKMKELDMDKVISSIADKIK